MPAPDNTRPGAGRHRYAHFHARHRLGLDPGCFVVLHEGGMTPRSGIDTIILGLAMLQRHHGICVTLLVVDAASDNSGTLAGAERARLRQLTRELGIEKWVHFMAGPAGADCLAAADVLVGMPWRSPGGRRGPPSMGWIRPAPDAHRAAGAIIDGVTGWLIPSRDARTLADRLARLLRQPGRATVPDTAKRIWVPA